MARGWEQMEQNTDANDFLKLGDGESVLAVLEDEPMFLSKHTLEDGTAMGQRFYCGRPEGMGCPVCDHPEDFKLKDARIKQEGLFPLFIVSRNKNGQTVEVGEHKILSGAWSVIGAFKEAKSSQDVDGDDIGGVPLRITRTGEKAQTRYSVIPKPKLKVSIEGDPIPVEYVGLKMIEKDHERVSYATLDPETGDERDPFENE